ncbi:MAG TPA: hypothetical protein VL172_17905, partial [Kofleriaceae bacterium]|nr:hypothetical protein [Kofleriaceae bacterium]
LDAAGSAGAELALDLRRRVAEQLLRGGYVDRGLTAIDSVLSAIGVRMPRGPLASLLAFLGRRLQLALRGRRWTRRDAASLPTEELTRLDAFGTIGKSLPLVDPVRGAYALTRALLVALRLGEPARVARMLAFEGGYLAAFGRQERAAALVRIAEQEAQRTGDAEALALAANVEAIIQYLGANRWRDALRGQTEADLRNRELQAAGWETDTSQLFACFNLMYLGEVAELTRRVAAYLAEAKRRGDRYHEVSLRTRLGLIWLAVDDPERASREAAEGIASWLPASRGFHVQHLYALHTRCEAWLYRGDPASAAAAMTTAHRLVRRSLLLNMSMLRVEYAHLSGRIALAMAARATPGERRAGIRRARRFARQLVRTRRPVAEPLAALLNAGADAIAGRDQRAAEQLRAAIAGFDALDTGLHAAAARRRLGQLLGAGDGTALIADGDAFMARQGIRNPERMTEMLIPHWAPAGG